MQYHNPVGSERTEIGILCPSLASPTRSALSATTSFEAATPKTTICQRLVDICKIPCHPSHPTIQTTLSPPQYDAQERTASLSLCPVRHPLLI